MISMMQRGFRTKLDTHFDINKEIIIEITALGPSVYDHCCFGVDASDKLSDDRYMVFYNQKSTPNHEITYIGSDNTASYRINLSKLPTVINKLVFTISIDGFGEMNQLSNCKLSIKQNNNELSLSLSGTDFQKEKP